MAHRIEVVAFDLGRVLVKIDFDAFPRELGITRDGTHTELEAKIEALAAKYETGQVTTEVFLSHLGEAFGHRFERSRLLHAWNAIIGEQNDEIVPIVEAVRKRFRTAMISNTSASHFAEAERKAPVLELIQDRFLSFRIGSMKPDRRVYERVLSSLRLPAEAVLFVDDLQVNVSAAESVGMRGVLYTGAPDLQKTLKILNIL